MKDNAVFKNLVIYACGIAFGILIGMAISGSVRINKVTEFELAAIELGYAEYVVIGKDKTKFVWKEIDEKKE